MMPLFVLHKEMAMFFYFLHTASVHLRTSIFYLASAAILVSVVLLLAASFTFQKTMSVMSSRVKTHQKDHWIWAVIPFVMLLVMLIPVINISIWK